VELLLTNPWVPVEWIRAHGLAPRGVWSLSSNVPGGSVEGACAFAQNVQLFSRTLSGTPVIYTTACDQMRRAADTVMGCAANPIFLLNLPATWQTAAARQLYRAELDRLSQFLQRHGGCMPTAAALSAEMCNQDKRREKIHQWIKHVAARPAAEAMAGFFSGAPLPERGVQARRQGVPLALVGGPLCAAQWDVFDRIEEAGGCVVLNAVEPGERCLLPTFPAAAKEPGRSLEGLLDILCDHYFDHVVDVFQRPNSRLYIWLQGRLAATCARGIILWVHVGCDLWRVEAASLRESFAMPVLVLDAPDVGGGSLRDENRIGAFVESLR
jgi:hypothetical protein